MVASAAAMPPARPSPTARRGRTAAILACSGLVHALALLAVLSLRADPPAPAVAPLQLALAPLPQPPLTPPAAPAPAPALARRTAAPIRAPHDRPARPRLHAVTAAVSAALPTQDTSGLGDAELAGAATASAGGGGGACDMIARVQRALRADRTVRLAVGSESAGRAFRVWNGDWLAHPGQDGHGIAAVREAILWEVGFAPAACRAQRVRGLVVVSLSDAPDAPRLAWGAGEWRWSDLLTARGLGGTLR